MLIDKAINMTFNLFQYLFLAYFVIMTGYEGTAAA